MLSGDQLRQGAVYLHISGGLADIQLGLGFAQRNLPALQLGNRILQLFDPILDLLLCRRYLSQRFFQLFRVLPGSRYHTIQLGQRTGYRLQGRGQLGYFSFDLIRRNPQGVQFHLNRSQIFLRLLVVLAGLDRSDLGLLFLIAQIRIILDRSDLFLKNPGSRGSRRVLFRQLLVGTYGLFQLRFLACQGIPLRFQLLQALFRLFQNRQLIRQLRNLVRQLELHLQKLGLFRVHLGAGLCDLSGQGLLLFLDGGLPRLHLAGTFFNLIQAVLNFLAGIVQLIPGVGKLIGQGIPYFLVFGCDLFRGQDDLDRLGDFPAGRHGRHTLDTFNLRQQFVFHVIRQIPAGQTVFGHSGYHNRHHIRVQLHDDRVSHGIRPHGRDLIQAFPHLDGNGIHVRSLPELQNHHGNIFRRNRLNILNIADRSHGAFHRLRHRALHFLRACAYVGGVDHGVGHVHAGQQIRRHMSEGYNAENNG